MELRKPEESQRSESILQLKVCSLMLAVGGILCSSHLGVLCLLFLSLFAIEYPGGSLTAVGSRAPRRYFPWQTLIKISGPIKYLAIDHTTN